MVIVIKIKIFDCWNWTGIINLPLQCASPQAKCHFIITEKWKRIFKRATFIESKWNGWKRDPIAISMILIENNYHFFSFWFESHWATQLKWKFWNWEQKIWTFCKYSENFQIHALTAIEVWRRHRKYSTFCKNDPKRNLMAPSENRMTP